MPERFLLPDLGEGLTEAEILEWRVAPGDAVAVDQVIVEVESAKSVVELPVPFAGTVGELLAPVGSIVHAGEALITVVTATEAAESPDGASGAVLVGYGTRESTMRLRRPTGGRFGRGAPDSPTDRAAGTSAGSASAGGVSVDTALANSASQLLDSGRRSRVASPLLRRMAREAGFDATTLAGTGPDGLVVRNDVESAIAAMRAEPEPVVPQPVASEPVAPQSVAPEGATSGADASSGHPDDDVRIPIAGVRKIIGTRLTHSRQTVPEVTIWLEVDATPLLDAMERLRAATGDRYSLTTLIGRFTIAGLKQYPALNSSVDESAQVIVQHAAVNLGIAAQTPRGLLVPVIHDAHELATPQLRERVADLVERSKTGEFTGEQLTGGTFTLNNYGAFGVDGSTPIINLPEVGMLGIGRLLDRPWAVDGQVVVRKVLTLTLVFDHRVCDGDVASGFLTYIARCVEEPLLAL